MIGIGAILLVFVLGAFFMAMTEIAVFGLAILIALWLFAANPLLVILIIALIIIIKVAK